MGSLAILFMKYCQQTFVSVMFAMYSPDFLKDKNEFLRKLDFILCEHLNQCYKSVLLQDDCSVIADWAPFEHHSPVCVFRIMHRVILRTSASFDFDYMLFSDKKTMMSVVQAQWNARVSLDAGFHLAETCSGIKRKDCDPTAPLFTMHFPESFMEARCATKGCSKLAFLRCSRCKKAFYCTAKHQKKDWIVHKLTCK
jgi:hypothetical protein